MSSNKVFGLSRGTQRVAVELLKHISFFFCSSRRPVSLAPILGVSEPTRLPETEEPELSGPKLTGLSSRVALHAVCQQHPSVARKASIPSEHWRPLAEGDGPSQCSQQYLLIFEEVNERTYQNSCSFVKRRRLDKGHSKVTCINASHLQYRSANTTSMLAGRT